MGCASVTQEVEIETKGYSIAQKKRFKELDSRFNKQYQKDIEQFKANETQEDYEEYIELKEIILPPFKNYEKLSATLNIKKRIIQIGANEVYHYEEPPGVRIELPDTLDSRHPDTTFYDLVASAKFQYKKAVDHNRELIWKSIWFPLMLIVYALVSILNPNAIAMGHDDYRYGRREPSKFTLKSIQVSGWLCLGIAAYLFYSIWQTLL